MVNKITSYLLSVRKCFALGTNCLFVLYILGVSVQFIYGESNSKNLLTSLLLFFPILCSIWLVVSAKDIDNLNSIKNIDADKKEKKQSSLFIVNKWILFSLFFVYLSWMLSHIDNSSEALYWLLMILILLFVLTALCVSVYIVCEIFKDSDEGRINEIKKIKIPLSVFFLGSFIGISYLFSFVLVFDHKIRESKGEKSLYINPESYYMHSLNQSRMKKNRDLQEKNDASVQNEKLVNSINAFKKLKSPKGSNEEQSDENQINNISIPIEELNKLRIELIEVSRFLPRDFDSVVENVEAILEENLSDVDMYKEKYTQIKRRILTKVPYDVAEKFLEQLESVFYSRMTYSKKIKFDDSSVDINASAHGEDNLKAIKAIVDFIKRDNDNKRIMITLVGRTDNRKPNDNGSEFNTNYELSEFRTMAVKSSIIRGLLAKDRKWPNIEWQILPSGNENFTISNNSGNGGENNLRAVDIYTSVLPDHVSKLQRDYLFAKYHNPEMQLLEYIYFMIYTITTTGYGDIVPVSPLSKTIVSVANILEVLFMVILFNILIGSNVKEASSNERLEEQPELFEKLKELEKDGSEIKNIMKSIVELLNSQQSDPTKFEIEGEIES